MTFDLWCWEAPLEGCALPKPYPTEFREDVIRVARNREPGVRIKDIAAGLRDIRVLPAELVDPSRP
ncbi:MAG TPA: hypothetical protein VFH02_13380 [Jiangellaceae bacterium]|nr:hypothetical protein [Jiangellaceae bacterium]